MRDFLPKVNTSSESVLVRFGKRNWVSGSYPFVIGEEPLLAHERRRPRPIGVVVVTVYREEAFVDLPERASEVQRPADRVRRRDLSRFLLNMTL